MKNKIEDLRNHLFEMLETIKDPDAKVDLERYKLGNELAQTIINSAKAEVDFLKTIGGSQGTDFIPDGTRRSADVRAIGSK